MKEFFKNIIVLLSLGAGLGFLIRYAPGETYTFNENELIPVFF